MEHLQHFGLTQDPFTNEPDLRFYFDSASHKDSFLRVDRGIRQNKGLCVLTGEAGTGKSLLTRRLFESLEEEIFEVSLMVMLPGATDASSVLSRYARQLGIEEPSQDRSALMAQIYESLAIIREEGRQAVLIIDDAHVLSREAMAEIGGLLNMEYEERRLLSLMVVGMPELDEAMSGDTSLLQRVDVRVRLMPLDLANTTAYLAHRLNIVGGQVEVLPSSTLETLFKYGRGRPRLINTLADNALFEAYLSSRSQVEATDVERAARDLGIGPDPGSTFNQLSPMPAVAFDPIATEVSASTAGTSLDLGVTAVSGSTSPVVGELTDPSGGPTFDTQAPSADQSSSSTLLTELGGILEESDAGGEELTRALERDSQMSGGTVDLDAEVEAVLAEQDSGSDANPLPVFEAENASDALGAEATRVGLPGPMEGTSDDIAELDDLFVELIEE